jgi:hypothetical protein
MSQNRGRWSVLLAFALAASYLCVHVSSLQAQTVSGTILGQIQDQQGAAIGKVEVSARNLDTGAVRTATTDDAGAYRITSVPAGSYEVSAAIAGFKTEVRSGINVTVGSDVAVNFALTVGAISEKVEVTAEAPQVDASSSTLGGFVNSPLYANCRSTAATGCNFRFCSRASISMPPKFRMTLCEPRRVTV